MTETEKINFKQMQISGIKACDDTSDGEHYSHFDRIYTCLEDYMKILDEEIGRLEQRSRSWWKRLMDKAGCL